MPITLIAAARQFIFDHPEFASFVPFEKVHTGDYSNKLTDLMHAIVTMFRTKNDADEKHKNILPCPDHIFPGVDAAYNMPFFQTSMRNLCLSTSPDRCGKMSITGDVSHAAQISSVIPIIDYKIDTTEKDAWKNIEVTFLTFSSDPLVQELTFKLNMFWLPTLRKD